MTNQITIQENNPNLLERLSEELDYKGLAIAKLFLNRNGWIGLTSRVQGIFTKKKDIEGSLSVNAARLELEKDYLNLIYQIGANFDIDEKRVNAISYYVYALEKQL